MACKQLEELRQQAATARKEFLEKKERARQMANKEGGPYRGKSDYEDFLLRKLMKLASDIEAHIAKHKCEDLSEHAH